MTVCLRDVVMCQQGRRGTDRDDGDDDLIDVSLLSDLRRRRDIYLLAAIHLLAFQPVLSLGGFSPFRAIYTEGPSVMSMQTPMHTPCHVTCNAYVTTIGLT